MRTLLTALLLFTAMPLHAFKILCMVGKFPALEEPFVLNQITGLIDRGHEVSIYATTGDKNNEIYQPQVETYHLIERTFYRKLPQNLSVDIVMCQFGPCFATYKQINWYYHLKNKKVITFFRGSDITITDPACASICKKLTQECDLILPVCDYFKQRLIDAGCCPEKIITVHSAIDCSKFTFKTRSRAPHEPIHIVTTARLHEQKGLDYAIRAFALIKEKYPDATYTFIGAGPFEQELRTLIESLNLKDNVHLVGRKTHEEIIRILDTTHIAILPSVTTTQGQMEGIPNALKEAMAMGIPTIGTYHSGNPELITDGVSGYLVPERDAAALAQKIEYVIEHPELWPALGTAARQKIEQEFEIERENDKLALILEQLMAK